MNSDYDEILSEGEDPVPSCVRKNNKRKILSDSDDEEKKNVVRKRSKKKIEIESDSDSSPSKSTKHVAKNDEFQDSDDSDNCHIVDNKDFKVSKKKKKTDLPKGQTKLILNKKTSPKMKENIKKSANLSYIDPESFFKSLSVPIKKQSSQLPKPSPKTSKKVEEDEFADSDDSFDKPITAILKKKEKTPEKKPKKTVKKDDVKKSPEKSVEIKIEKPVIKSPKKEVTSKPIISTSVVPSEQSRIGTIPSNKVNQDYLSWVDKYKPSSLQHLVGQHGDKSPMNKLLHWLKQWATLNLGEGAKVKRAKPAPWLAQTDGTAFKAALLSGSPGVGKTTCAYLACNELGYKYVEMNASDVRNKKFLESKVGELSGSHQIDQYFGKSKPQDNLNVHHVLIMDEVDGMSGNEDRAGISELIQIIKETKIPILCICNDRLHPKIRSLASHCYDLRFHKPKIENIRTRMMTICCREKLKIPRDELDQIIELSGYDVRQTIYNLQMRSMTNNSNISQKNQSWGPFDAARRLLDPTTNIFEKSEMFFVDYSIMPLFVQEHYVNLKNEKHSPLQAIQALRKASDYISLGDTIDKQIRSCSAWKLLPDQSMLSTALPTMAIGGNLKGMLQFPSWLGKNSTAGKRHRLLQQLVMHTHLRVSSTLCSFALDYAPMLRVRVTKPLIEKESEGIPEVIETMKEYDLIKDDSDALSEIVVWPGKIDPASKILSKVKSALTRRLNKETRMLPYSLDEISKSKKKGVNAIGVEMDEDGNLVEMFEDDESGDEETSSEVVVKKSAGGGSSGKTGRGGTTVAKRGRGRGKVTKKE